MLRSESRRSNLSKNSSSDVEMIVESYSNNDPVQKLRGRLLSVLNELQGRIKVDQSNFQNRFFNQVKCKNCMQLGHHASMCA